MRFLLPVILLLLGVGGGAGAGLFFSNDAASQEGAGDTRDAADDSHEASSSSEGDDHSESAAAPSGATEFVRLNNQFIVPVVEQGTVRSLVILVLTLEIDTGQNGVVFDREPRLRDAFLQAMFAHANVGGFDGYFTEASALAPLRQGLKDAARMVLGGIVHDVLIVDITRQDS